MAITIDFNCDMGESFGAYTIGDDAAMLDLITSANIACGFHGGDPLVMSRAVTLARAKNIAIGAHPSFLDLWGFGRRPILGDTPDEVGKFVLYQIGALQAIAAAAGHAVTHVKMHGSLANMAQIDQDLADGVARAIRTAGRDLIFVVMPGMATERAAEKHGLRMAREIYADRTYDDDGNLTSRKKEGAVIHDGLAAAKRVLAMLDEQAIRTVTGAKRPVKIDSICVHGDNPAGVEMARQVRASVEQAGARIAPFNSFV